MSKGKTQLPFTPEYSLYNFEYMSKGKPNSPLHHSKICTILNKRVMEKHYFPLHQSAICFEEKTQLPSTPE